MPGADAAELGSIEVNRDGLEHPQDQDPLSALLGVPLSWDEVDELQAEVLRLREDFVVGCMAEQGHEYIPDIRHNLANVDAADLGETRFYGVTDNVELILSEPAGEWESPNLAVLEGLSPEGQEAWSEAFGRQDSGCQGASFETHPDVGAIPAALGEEILALEEKIEFDHAVVSAWAVWANCMKQNGFESTNRNELVRHLEDYGFEIALAGEATDQLLEAEAVAFAADSMCSESSAVDEAIATVTHDVRSRYVEANADRIALLLDEHRNEGEIGP
ncbi:MAG: hypothetical protein GY925_13355 [Actinomycetia bacterium]|nr:hypothetical protein [Actinomycetes bacterium]